MFLIELHEDVRATAGAKAGFESTHDRRWAYSSYQFSIASLTVRLHAEVFQRRFLCSYKHWFLALVVLMPDDLSGEWKFCIGMFLRITVTLP